MSATASLKLPEEDRENQHKENVPVTQSCLGGPLPGSFLMLEQEKKLHKWSFPILTILWLRDVIELPLCGAGFCFRASAVTAVTGPACPARASREGNRAGAAEAHPASGYLVMHQYVWNKQSFRLLYFLTSAEKRERKRQITATRCGIPSFCFGKESAEGSQRARENEWGVFCAFDSKPEVCLRGSTSFQWVWVWTSACFEKRGARGVQKVPFQEKVLHHVEMSPPHTVRNEVGLEIPVAGKCGEVTYSVRERESFQIFVFYLKNSHINFLCKGRISHRNSPQRIELVFIKTFPVLNRNISIQLILEVRTLTPR